MKNILLFIIPLLFSFIISAQVNPNNHYVEGYHRSDGTYVKGHYRTNPNSTNRDNYTTKPNTNPYTGEKGYIAPDNKHNSYSNYNSTNYSQNNIYNSNNSTNYNKAYSSYTELIKFHNNSYSQENRQLIEQILYDLNFLIGSADGYFTKTTIKAIKKLQDKIGIYPSGKFDKKTIKRIEKIMAKN